MGSFKTSEEAAQYVASRYGRPNWATGTISRADAAFLFDLITREQPRSIAEIGIAAGVSTAFLATLLSDRLRDSQMYSFDYLDYFYDQPTRPVAAYVYELFEKLPAQLTLAGGVASTAIRAWQGRPQSFDFVFLDANHSHPWPCIDLLSVLDLVAPGSWVALHDVRLPMVSYDYAVYGPLYLYQLWPGEKCIAAASDANIAAIRLFDDPTESAASLIACCRLPWQMHLPYKTWTSSIQALAQIDPGSGEALRSVLEAPLIARRPILRDCEIVVRGTNRWSHWPSNLTSGHVVLHANREDETPIGIAVRGLSRAQCNGIIAPWIVHSSDSAIPLSVSLSLTSAATGYEARETFTLTDDSARFASLLAPATAEGFFDVEMSVRLAEKTSDLNGAWVKLEALHFV